MTAAPDDPWAAHAIGDASREAIARFLLEQRAAIVEAGTAWVVDTAVDLQGRRPRDETRALVARVVERHDLGVAPGVKPPREVGVADRGLGACGRASMAFQ